MDPKYLTVRCDVRLPDVHNTPKGYTMYGRAAILNTGSLWVGNEKTSHPKCKIGFYYAVSGNVMFLSPRGVAADWMDSVSDDLIRTIAKVTGLKNSYRHFNLLPNKSPGDEFV